MNQNDMSFVVSRKTQDRRSGRQLAPPYMTEEGMVLFDRRAGEDRRTGMMQSLLGGLDLHTFIHGGR
ncbi:MAG TPA: hypothetical protein VIF60_14500 [Burkholderiaceae bacterium]|jgi:hypothetical protein